MGVIRNSLTLWALSILLQSGAWGQSVWTIPKAEPEPQMDGRLNDWQGIEPLVLAPFESRARREGDFAAQDELRVELRAAWTKEGLYMAVLWKDDVWDVREVPRREAVWISPEGRRRNRMLFFDHINLEMRRENFHYLVWVSPRHDGRGPFSWARRVGEDRLEMASSPPLISVVADEAQVAMEWLFPWKELGIKPKRYKDLFFRLQVTDSDLKDSPLELKTDKLKSLLWAGRMEILKK